ncbi:hypothetical protein E2C01_080929 [Portunus trituberculatus]|uniref:Uncharacterized protein n=1 Tax=Portunus trituberculatus TaxID=210409 RepID=A0A5B7IUW6_PORTR|nr:hypothetical protein [Portunus trituberculatus]
MQPRQVWAAVSRGTRRPSLGIASGVNTRTPGQGGERREGHNNCYTPCIVMASRGRGGSAWKECVYRLPGLVST